MECFQQTATHAELDKQHTHTDTCAPTETPCTACSPQQAGTCCPYYYVISTPRQGQARQMVASSHTPFCLELCVHWHARMCSRHTYTHIRNAYGCINPTQHSKVRCFSQHRQRMCRTRSSRLHVCIMCMYVPCMRFGKSSAAANTCRVPSKPKDSCTSRQDLDPCNMCRDAGKQHAYDVLAGADTATSRTGRGCAVPAAKKLWGNAPHWLVARHVLGTLHISDS